MDNKVTDPMDALDTFLESIDILKFKLDTLAYTACYCEENIYMLCKKIKEGKPELLPHISVIYVSNHNRSVPLWQQKAGRGEEHMVVWDYHVILLYKNKGESVIYDFDTVLPFPSPLDIYIMETFRPNLSLKEEYQPSFRFIPADAYLNEFQSDRSHMLKEDGTYIAEPPRYPPITKTGSNLDSYISMEIKGDQFGKVYTSYELYETIFT